VWIVALCPDAGACQERALAYGVHPIHLEKDPEDWGGWARNWLREHQVPGAVAMLVDAPSCRNPNANHRLEFLRVDGKPQINDPEAEP
jgi:pyruvate kinase